MIRLLQMLTNALFFVTTLNIPIRAQTSTCAIDVVGDWYVADSLALIRITQEQGAFYGNTIWMKMPNNLDGSPKQDTKDPGPSKRQKQLVGSRVLYSLKYAGEGVWDGGTIYDARSGKTYKCKITMKERSTIAVRGYIGFSLIGASTTSHRKQVSINSDLHH